jgi:hypothetical protein
MYKFNDLLWVLALLDLNPADQLQRITNYCYYKLNGVGIRVLLRKTANQLTARQAAKPAPETWKNIQQ